MNWNTGGGSGGGSTTIIQGNKNHIVPNIADMNAITTPKNGDMCHVTSTKELYMYKDGTWNIIPTGDMFYNKLASTSQIGHVQLTSDITLESEDLAITPKALKLAMDELRALIESLDWEDLEQSEWDELFDGVDNVESGSTWDDLDNGVDETEDDHTWEEW